VPDPEIGVYPNTLDTDASGTSTLRFTNAGGAAAALFENSTNQFTFQNAVNNGTIRFQTTTVSGSTLTALTVDSSQNIGIGTTTPQAKLDVAGSIRIADDSTAASATNVGATRYRSDANNSYMDMVMQTGAGTYAWINIVQNTW